MQQSSLPQDKDEDQDENAGSDGDGEPKDGTSSSSTRPTAKQAAGHPLENSNKNRNGVAVAKDRHVEMSGLSNLDHKSDNITPPVTPSNYSSSPTLVHTESLESIEDVYTVAETDPFHVHKDEDEGEEDSILMPDKTEQVCRFSAMLSTMDVALGFQPVNVKD
ncbi:hypothetical protein BGZ83_010706 [Gryganskiella cystojenkinii]|nr:hypothetical protein BGZ83_010706 [Gryganskiella cystojenkinii]